MTAARATHMNQRFSTIRRRLVVAVMIVAAGCSSENIFEHEDARRNHAPQLLEYRPTDTSPEIILGDEIEFFVRASDPDGDKLYFQFTVDDTVVSTSTRYVHRGRLQGAKRAVRVVVSDGTLDAITGWSLTVTGPPDSVAPAVVTITSVERGPDPHEIDIWWLAVGDDGMDGRATSYTIGVSDFPIVDQSNWDRARQYTIPGAAADPGTEMTQVLSLSKAGSETVVAVRAVDDKGNLSPLGDYSVGYTRGYTYSGEVRDVMTDLPISDAIIKFPPPFQVTTDQNGQWAVAEAPNLNVLVVSDDGVPRAVGDYYDYRIDDPNLQNGFHSVYLFPNLELESNYYPGFFVFFLAMTEMPGVPYPSYLRHWDLPIDIYVPPFEANGLDFKATVERVVVDLENDLGFPVFRVVDSPPAVGVECGFRGGITADNYGTYEWTEDWYPVRGRVEFRTHYSPASLLPFERVIRHEMGHALGLSHSNDPNHLMVGGQTQQVDTFSPDEVAVIQIIYGVPGGVAVGSYLDD